MSPQALRSETTSPRVLVVDDNGAHEVFAVIGLLDGVVRARSPYLFEIGEEMRVRVEQDGGVFDAVARVRGHVGPADSQITELELSEQSDVRRMVSG